METTSGNVVSKDKSLKKRGIMLACKMKNSQEMSDEPRTGMYSFQEEVTVKF